MRFHDILAQRFPDESIASLTAAADLEHSLSGSYVRGLLRSHAGAWAVLAAAPGENPAIYDGLLTFGLIWLDRALHSAQGNRVAGLRLFFPEGTGRATAHRVDGPGRDDNGGALRVRRTERPRTADGSARRRECRILAHAAARDRGRPQRRGSFLERVRRYAPDAIRPHIVPGARCLEVRYRGLALCPLAAGRRFLRHR